MLSRDPKNWMWLQACEMLEQAERLHRQFFQLGAGNAGAPSWEPPVDVFETNSGIEISVALPGVSPASIRIQLRPGVVEVAARRVMPAGARSVVIRRLEIPYGRFVRQISLPAGTFEIERQEMIDGCVQLTLRKLT